jgi:vacuolar-type H+-ATPase subunit F/Vma7
MKTTLAIVCRPELGPAFALAGVSCLSAEGGEEAAGRLRSLLAVPGTGVVLVQEDLYARLPEDVKRDAARRGLPMVVPFPGPAWEAGAEGAEERLIEILRQAIGYRVRLR